MSLGRPFILLSLVPVRLQHQVTFRKNSLLDSSCTGRNHIHVPQLLAQVTSLINQVKEDSLKTVATCVFPETASPNFRQCLSKLYLSQLKCSFSSTKFLSQQSYAILLFILYHTNIFWAWLTLSFRTIQVYEHKLLPFRGCTVIHSEQHRESGLPKLGLLQKWWSDCPREEHRDDNSKGSLWSSLIVVHHHILYSIFLSRTMI